MPQLFEDACAKSLVRWKTIKEYHVIVVAFCIITALSAIMLLVLAASETPKGQYANAEFPVFMFVLCILVILMTGGVSILAKTRYNAWKRTTLSDPSLTEKVVDVLINRTWKLNSTKHKAVIFVLGDMRGKRAIPFIISALQSNSNSAIREEAIKAIAQTHDAAAIVPLVAALEDDSPFVRINAAEALDNLAWKSQNRTEEANYLFAKQNWKNLACLGEPAVEILTKALTCDNLEIRFNTAIALKEIVSNVGYLGDKAVDALIQALKDKSNLVRMRAAETLGIIGSEKAIEPLKKAKRIGQNSLVVAEAERALKRIAERQNNK